MKFIVVSCIVVLAFIFSAEARVRLSSGSSRVKLSSPSKSSGNGKSWFSNSGGGPKAQVGTQPRGPTAPVPQPGQLTRGVGFGGEQVPSASGLRSGIRNVGGAVRGYVGGILQSPETQDFLQQAVGGVMNYQQQQPYQQPVDQYGQSPQQDYDGGSEYGGEMGAQGGGGQQQVGGQKMYSGGYGGAPPMY